MIKASSIAYAIVISLLVGIFCYSLLVMSGYAKMHQTVLFSDTELITTNESAENYFLGRIEAMNTEQHQHTVDLFENGITSSGVVKRWGFYEVLTTSSTFKKDTVKRSTLIGVVQQKNNLALYLSDASKALFVVGKSSITGNVFLPKRGIKQAYISSSSYRTSNFLKGTKSIAKVTLPQIVSFEEGFESANSRILNSEEIKDILVFHNPFTNPTVTIVHDAIKLEKKNFSGNIILTSKDSIYIRKDNVLRDIIIDAPKVVFENGFNGAVQVVAEQSVTIEENVTLAYPSGIFMSKAKDDKLEMTIGKGSKVLGGIVVDKGVTKNYLKQLVTIDTGAEVIGDVYCNGNLQLKGAVTGTVYASNFYLKTEASVYDNYILDGTIDSKALPQNFLRIPLFKSKNNKERTYEIIKPI